MIWTTWRQHRAEAGVGALILAALVVSMLTVGTTARDRAHALGLPGCTGARGDCSGLLEALHRDFHTIPPFTAALIAVPLLAGMFWAAPLVSREYEAGTHRLAWTQSVSPLRWITVKIAVIFGVLTAAALVLGLLATWTLDPLTDAFGGRFNSTWYDTQGHVPAACMLFALAVGVAASALIRRTIPAMSVTLVVYAAARIPIHFFRVHFAPLSTRSLSVPLASILDSPDGSPSDAVTSTLSPADWLQTVVVIDPYGRPIPANSGNRELLQHYCANLPDRGDLPRAAVQACSSRLHGLSYHGKITYQGHFWLIQAVECAIFLGLAALLVAAAVLAVTRHRPS
jgi:hypothetical protein